MSVLHRSQPPWSVPAPPGSTIEADSSESTATCPRSTARDRDHTPLYGVPILARKDEEPRYAELGETTDIPSAVVGEIRVEARTVRPAAPSKTVVVDPKLAAALVQGAPDPRRGRGRLLVLGVGGVAVVVIAIWAAVRSGCIPSEETSARTTSLLAPVAGSEAPAASALATRTRPLTAR